MVKFVFVGNPDRKIVRDKETGAARTFKADREEPDSFKMVTRDGQKAYVFMKDHVTEVDDERMIKTLRGNNHFRELDAKNKPVEPTKASEPQVIMPEGVEKTSPAAADPPPAADEPSKDDRNNLFR